MPAFHPWEMQPQGPIARTAGDAITAEFFGGKRPVLDAYRTRNGRRERVGSWPVSDKREARALAKTLEATPWNF